MIYPAETITRAEVSQHYDQLDHFYRAIWGEDLHYGLWANGNETVAEAVNKLTQLVARLAKVKCGDRVCDIGCGYGSASEMLANEYGARVLGVTVSQQQLKMAQRRVPLQGRLKFQLVDWLHNGLPSHHFDSAIAIESSEHMVDKNRFFTEARRVLKPGGRIVICAWTAAEKPTKWQAKYLLEPICREGRWPSLLNGSEYRSGLKAAGFHKIKTMDHSRAVAATWNVSLSRTARYFALRPWELPYLIPLRLRSADFARSLVRLSMAYRFGAMKYLVFHAEAAPTLN